MGEVIELQMDIKNLRKIGTVSEKTLVPPGHDSFVREKRATANC